MSALHDLALVLRRHAVDVEMTQGVVRCTCADTAWFDNADDHREHQAGALLVYLRERGVVQDRIDGPTLATLPDELRARASSQAGVASFVHLRSEPGATTPGS